MAGETIFREVDTATCFSVGAPDADVYVRISTSDVGLLPLTPLDTKVLSCGMSCASGFQRVNRKELILS